MLLSPRVDHVPRLADEPGGSNWQRVDVAINRLYVQVRQVLLLQHVIQFVGGDHLALVVDVQQTVDAHAACSLQPQRSLCQMASDQHATQPSSYFIPRGAVVGKGGVNAV